MLLSFLAFALSMRCIRSYESSPRNQPLYVEEPHVHLHEELMDPFLNSQPQDHYESAILIKMATAISETETTIDGYRNSVVYSRRGCQGAVLSVSSISLNNCYNLTTSKKRYIKSYRYSYTSQMSNETMSLYSDDKCQSFIRTQKGPASPSCEYIYSISYSPTMSLSTLPPEPYARSS